MVENIRAFHGVAGGQNVCFVPDVVASSFHCEDAASWFLVLIPVLLRLTQAGMRLPGFMGP